MISRRIINFSMLAAPFVLRSLVAHADETDPIVGQDTPFQQLAFPPIDSIDNEELFGYSPPTEAQRSKAAAIINATPKGPTAFDVAKSFITRFAKSDPDAISQWPAPQAWNPLVKEFFSATSLRVNNDMVDWCAAFVNWCIERNNKKGTNSAASQSFANSGILPRVDTPKQGDLVVFTCYDKQSGKSLGIGHVAFFEETTGANTIRVIGGNQSADGHSSIISERQFLTTPFDVHRHVGGEYVACIYKLNGYFSIV